MRDEFIISLSRAVNSAYMCCSLRASVLGINATEIPYLKAFSSTNNSNNDIYRSYVI